jgi:hypothetical protein
MRLLWGLDRVPRGIPRDDPRLRGVELGPAPLRLNTEPVPAEIVPADTTHEARWAALAQWLEAACGDYAVTRRRAVAAYLDFVRAELNAHRAELADRAARFDGLYAAEDWAWSALRPLPRAWLGDDGPIDLAFWDGARLHRLDLAAPRFPDACRFFWRAELLPSSPFRRPFAWS